MPLSGYDKGHLETLINRIIADIEPVVEFARSPEFKGMLKDKDASDFSLGLVLAEIYTIFLTDFKKRNNGRNVTKEERAEVFRILGIRIGEIYDAIFKSG